MGKTGAGLWLLLCAAQCALAAFERQPSGPRLAALGGTGVGLPATAWVVPVNPAACAGIRDLECALGFSPGLFGLPEMRRTEGAAAFPMGPAALSFSMSHFGFDLYRESVYGLGAGLMLTPYLRAGVMLHGYRLSIPGYGNGWSLGVDAGLQWDVVDGLSVGCAAAGINAPSIGESPERLPRPISVGVDYRPVTGSHILLDLVKEARFPAELHLGVEYALLEIVMLRCGLVNEPPMVSGGIGLRWGMLQVDYALSLHDVLGETHEFGILLRLGEP